MKKVQIFLLTVAVSLFGGVVSASDHPAATYDPVTGELVFSDVSSLVGLRINSPLAELVPGQLTNLGGATDGAFGVANDQAPNFIEWGNLVGMTFNSESAGSILPTGLLQTQLDSDFEFLYRTSGSPTVDVVGLISGGLAIPEPTSLALAGFGVIGLLSGRRRQS